MGKYDKFFPKFTEQEKTDLRAKIHESVDKIINDMVKNKDSAREMMHETIAWEDQGINKLDTVFVGAFTANEFLTNIGFKMEKYDDWSYKVAFTKALEQSNGTLSLDLKKDKNGDFVVEASEEAKSDINTLNDNEGKFKLNRWDKFCAFFGIKTEHARSVEMNVAAVEAYKEKMSSLQVMLTNKRILNKLSDNTNAFLKDNKEKYESSKAVVSKAKEQFDAWHKVFFGNENVPDYTLNNGKKVSPVSLCLMAVQQRSDIDLSKLSPEDFTKKLDKNPSIKKGVEQIANIVSAMAINKDKSLNMSLKFQHLNNFLLEKGGEIAAYDDKLKAMLKPKEARALNITVADEFRKLPEEKQDEKLAIFGKACVMFKAKDDMLKLFGENEKTYNMLNKDGQPVNKAASEMEKLVKNTFEAVNLYDAVQNGDYDKALNIIDEKSDYNKLTKVYEHGNQIFYEVSSEIKVSSVNKDEINSNLDQSVVYDNDELYNDDDLNL